MKSLKIALFLFSCLFATSVGAADVVTRGAMPVYMGFGFTCDDGLEDAVELQCEFRFVVIRSKSGVEHATSSLRSEDVWAVGMLTGDIYHCIDSEQMTETDKGDNRTQTFVFRFTLIGQDSGCKISVVEMHHLTVVDDQVIVHVDKDVEAHCL